MNLLLADAPVIEVRGDPAVVAVTGVEHDSRRARSGDLFCCIPGLGTDGHLFAAEAVRRGAVALLCERFVPELDVPQARVPEGGARAAMAAAAAALYGHPARELLMVGVTGTNGKTTVTRLIAAALGEDGVPTSVIGTLTGERTTPESTDLQRILAEVRDRQRIDGVGRAISMEVSSHALVQHRVDGIRFDVAAFTNLSHDHLDFHGSMEAYAAAKASLFEPERAVRGVVNADDELGRRLLEAGAVPLVGVRRSDATDVVLAAGRTEFTWRGQRVRLPLTGGFNVDNALLAAETAVAAGVAPEVVAQGLSRVEPLPGRMEVIGGPARGGLPFAVIVDYAHTPAGLEAVLGEGRALAQGNGRVLAVFGCGGDRDRNKRPLMGSVASRLADRTYLTTDNPRSENPLAIIEEIVGGVEATADVVVEPDRRTAIHRAVSEAEEGDVVIVAGKGHETYQEVGHDRRHFDDREVAAEVLTARFPDWEGSRVGRHGPARTGG